MGNPEKKAYKLTLNSTYLILFLAIYGLLAAFVLWYQGITTLNFAILSSFLFSLSSLFLSNRNTYQLEDEHLAVKRPLQKTKRIAYASMYKVKQTQNFQPKKFLIAKKPPYCLEVFYHKFEAMPVVVDEIEDFEKALKGKIANQGLSDRVAFESSLL